MKTLKDIESLMEEYGLSEFYEEIKKTVRNAVYMDLEPVSDDGIPVGTSKMGGLPDLPKNVDWFRQDLTDVPLSFICQINFAEIKQYDTADRLPSKGMLYFFYDCSMDGMPWGFDPNDGDGKVVYYYDGELSELERREAPEDIEENGCVFGSAALRFETALDLPDWKNFVVESLIVKKDDRDQYFEMLYETMSESLVNKLLGHSNNIQGGMEDECEFVTNGLYCGDSSGYKEGVARGLDKNIGQWNLLLQVDSNEDLGMMWGDCGRLYLWITDEDLAAKNFEAAWLILQCG